MISALRCMIPAYFVLISAFGLHAQAIQLIADRHSDYRIIIPGHCTDMEMAAARLLQQNIRKSTDCLIPIESETATERAEEIRIGPVRGGLDRFEGHPDGFEIVTPGKAICINGGNKKGILYAAEYFLEKYLQWEILAPGVEFFPRLSTVVIPTIRYSDSPANNLRIAHGTFDDDESYRNWMRLHTENEAFAKGFFVHTMQRLLPWQEYFGPHPEYYALLNGKRVIDQPCFSNPEVAAIVVENLRQAMKLQAGNFVWSVSQNDNETFCHCEKCLRIMEEEKSPSGPVIRFVNEVAAHFPDVTISTLAYQFSRHAPAVTRPAGNVQIVLCSIELNRSLPIAIDPASESFVKDLEEWSKITKNLFVWDYGTDFAHSISPFPNLHVLQPNLQLFSKYGVKYHFQQIFAEPGHDLSVLKSYLTAHLLWNPGANMDSLKAHFLHRYYGEAAPYISQYIDLLTDGLLASHDRLDIYEHPIVHENTFLGAEQCKSYDSLFALAAKAVAFDSTLSTRVATAHLPLMFAEMEIGKNQMFGPRGWYQEVEGQFRPKPEMIAMSETFYRTCQLAGVRTLDESGLDPETYYETTKRFINTQAQNNKAFRKTVYLAPEPAKHYSGGKAELLTDGVRGADDYHMHWLGWEDADAVIGVDLGEPVTIDSIEVSSLYYPKSWILHPARVQCSVSVDGLHFDDLGGQSPGYDQKSEPLVRTYVFRLPHKTVQHIRFDVSGTRHLPNWHASAGGKSWFFLDEVVAQ